MKKKKKKKNKKIIKLKRYTYVSCPWCGTHKIVDDDGNGGCVSCGSVFKDFTYNYS